MFRHTVEELFTAGLVKAVFATETLALGINMPARTVVLERLVKFNGEQHVPLTPGEYTQLTGRAGRRGIDVEGHAVVLWHPDVEPAEVAGLASTRTFPLRSSFAPSYNMTINLVQPDGSRRRRTSCWNGPSRSIRPTDRWSGWCAASSAASGCSTRSPPNSAAVTRAILEYVRLRAAISERERAQARASRLQRRKAANDALASLRRGDIINIANGRRGGLAVVLEAARDDDDPRPLVLTEHRWAGRISSADYSGASAKLGSMTLPKRVEHRQPRVRRDLASALRSAAAGLVVPNRRASAAARRANTTSTPSWPVLREQLRRHPAHGLPDREAKARARRALPAHRTRQRPDSAEDRGGDQLAGAHVRPDRRAADRARLHSVDAEAPEGRPTTAGCWPGSTAKAICWWPNACAAERGRAWRPPNWPRCFRAVRLRVARRGRAGAPTAATSDGGLRRALARPGGCPGSCAPTRTGTASRRPASPTRASSPPSTAGPPPATWPRRSWPSGKRGSGSGTPLSAGDFVRWCRQVLDLLDQVRNRRADAELRAAAKRAINDVRRGVVAVDSG